MELPLVGLHPWLAQYGWVVLVHQWSWGLGLVINLIVLYVCHDRAKNYLGSQHSSNWHDDPKRPARADCAQCRRGHQLSRRWSVLGLLVLATSVLYPIGGLYLLTGPLVVAAVALFLMAAVVLCLAFWVAWELLREMAENLQETFSWAFQKPKQ